MNISRTAFVKVCGLALCGCGFDAPTLEALVAAPPTVAPPPGRRFRWEDANAALFREHLHSTFEIHSTDGARARLVLAEVTERPPTRNVEQFSVIFHAPPGCSIPDGIHTLDHPSLGRLALFIAPIGASKSQRTVYQACFSRSAQAPRR